MRYYVTGILATADAGQPITLTYTARDLSDALAQLNFFTYGLEVAGTRWEVTTITTRKPRGVNFMEIT